MNIVLIIKKNQQQAKSLACFYFLKKYQFAVWPKF